MNAKTTLWCAALFGLSAVMLGAFGAHVLKSVLSEGAMHTFNTALKYQMWHALALLFVSVITLLKPSKLFRWAAACFVIGVLLFSGSLYLLAFGAPRWLGPVTPIGGLSFMLGWLCLLIAATKLKI